MMEEAVAAKKPEKKVRESSSPSPLSRLSFSPSPLTE